MKTINFSIFKVLVTLNINTIYAPLRGRVDDVYPVFRPVEAAKGMEEVAKSMEEIATGMEEIKTWEGEVTNGVGEVANGMEEDNN